MSGWSEVFLGIIAVATLATAVMQIAVLIAAGMLTKRIGRLADQVERDISPLLASLNSIGRDAAKAATLATAQVERADRLFGEGRYTESLRELAALKAPVDAFFDDVMVNAEDPALRANRLALLASLHGAMNRVADLSRLAA